VISKCNTKLLLEQISAIGISIPLRQSVGKSMI